MGIQIDELNVKDFGNISSKSQEFGKVNLIYGKNETGKTCLVEFMIRSLFKNSKKWGLRESIGKGKVVISGLTNKPEDFSPESPKKIEQYWLENKNSYPQDFSRLLVVKATEVAFTEKKTEIDTSNLKEFLSGGSFLDRIIEKMSKTLQNASIESNEIIGNDRGEVKKINELVANRNKLVELEKRISQNFSEGELMALKEKSNTIDSKLIEFEKAKRFKAYELDQKIAAVNKELAKYPS